MSINDYYFIGVFANHRGFNVSLAKINNAQEPDTLYLISSVSGSILSNEMIGQTIDEAIDSIDQPNGFMKLDKLVGILTNDNRNLQDSLYKHFRRGKHIKSYTSKDLSQSLYGLAEKIGSGKLMVKTSIAKDVQIDLHQTTDTEISHQINSLIIISDTFAKGWFRSLGMPVQRGMYMRC